MMMMIKEKNRSGGEIGGGGKGSQLAGGVSATFTTGMGKGLREPCSPYRQAYVFGADLNVPNANNWNCVPVIMDPTTSFDLSTITPNHEVVVALLVAYNIIAGASHVVSMKWYRDRDSNLLFDWSYTFPDRGYAWAYVYSYIGYVPWEIYENGNYHVDILWDGSLLQRIGFTVSGIPAGLAGQITALQILIGSMVVSVPGQIQQGQSGNVVITGRNNIPLAQSMGMEWEIHDPDGILVERFSTGSPWIVINPNNSVSFTGAAHAFNKLGVYTITAKLYLNEAAPLLVDRYSGELCTVVSVPTPLRPPPCGTYGDIDGDGFVTSNDALLVGQYLVGLVSLSSEQLRRADVDGDGQVTAMDAMMINQYALGVRDSFPVCVIPTPEFSGFGITDYSQV